MSHPTPKVTPYGNSETKKEQVKQMFDNISSKYDFLNRLLSFGIDVKWRNKLLQKVGNLKGKEVLDVATGTGDLAIAILKQKKPKKVIGLDLSPQMLEVAKTKEKNIEFIQGDSENLPYEDNSFDLVTVTFGVRNFENLDKGLSEIYRVLKTEGQLAVLEFGLPKIWIIRKIYLGYFSYILPILGKIFSKDNRAYTYLPKSVKQFPYANKFLDCLKKAGFNQNYSKGLSMGICYLYLGKK